MNWRAETGTLLRIWVACWLLGMVLPMCMAQTDLPLPQYQLPDVVAPVGSAFVLDLPGGSFGCKVDKFVVSVWLTLTALFAEILNWPPQSLTCAVIVYNSFTMPQV